MKYKYKNKATIDCDIYLCNAHSFPLVSFSAPLIDSFIQSIQDREDNFGLHVNEIEIASSEDTTGDGSGGGCRMLLRTVLIC